MCHLKIIINATIKNYKIKIILICVICGKEQNKISQNIFLTSRLYFIIINIIVRF